LIEIGAPLKDAKAPEGQSLTQVYGIPSASASPGQPVVYIYGRGYATVNPDAIVELHRRYGGEYDDSWVEPQWVSTIKEVQGRYPFDYLKENRGGMQNEVEAELQAQLVSEDGETPLVYVSQLAIRDYDYTNDVNSYLDTVAQREFARQEQEAQRQVNLQEQEARKIKAETEYLVQVREAEAKRDSQIAEAEGEAQRQRELADAQAYETRVTYEAEAEGIQQVVSALRGSSEYTEYIRAQQWNGTLPTWWMPGQDAGHSPVPILETAPEQVGGE
jgi:regulator of protease activity HflC (stomatin/prohibitin superfamily)